MYLVLAVVGSVTCLFMNGFFLDLGFDLPFYMRMLVGAVAGGVIPIFIKYFLGELIKMLLPSGVRRSMEEAERRRRFGA